MLGVRLGRCPTHSTRGSTRVQREGNEPCRNESLNGTWFRGIGGHNWVYPSVSSMPPSVTDRHSTKRGPSTANYFVIIRHDHLTPFSRAEGPKKCQTNACVHFIRSCQNTGCCKCNEIAKAFAVMHTTAETPQTSQAS